MTGFLKRWVDPLVVMLLSTLVLGIVVPVPESMRAGISTAGLVAIFMLFFAYGLRLPTREVLDGMRNFRLQGAILSATYLIFPALGLLASWAMRPLIGDALAMGVLFLSLLPSTVQGSVAITSVAKGNVSAAICAATVSNVLGIIVTPLLVLWLMGADAGADASGIRSILTNLLLPFVLGQLLSRWFGPWVRRHRWVTMTIDRGSIVIVLFGAVSSATADGVWTTVSVGMLLTLVALAGVLLSVMLAITWWGSAALKLSLADRVPVLMCGTQKSLATGLPMAIVLFPAATVATVALPVILYHQLQLVVCAILARALAQQAQ